MSMHMVRPRCGPTCSSRAPAFVDFDSDDAVLKVGIVDIVDIVDIDTCACTCTCTCKTCTCTCTWHAHDMHVHVCMYAHENVLASRLHACSTCCLLTCLQTCTRTDLHTCTLAHLHTYEGDQAHPAPRAEPVGGSHQVRKPCRRRCRAHPAALRGVCLAPAVLSYICCSRYALLVLLCFTITFIPIYEVWGSIGRPDIIMGWVL